MAALVFAAGLAAGLALSGWLFAAGEPPADYRFRQGAYTLYCQQFPDHCGTVYSFILHKNRRQVGQPLIYQWDGIDPAGFAQWWGAGVVEGGMDGAEGVLDVGNCRLRLDFAAQRMELTRVYREETPRELLAACPDQNREVYRFDLPADPAVNPGGALLLQEEIALYNTQTGEYTYLCSGTGCYKVLFDRRNNLFCCSWWGIRRYTADSGREKPLSFDFPSDTVGEYVFLDFCYDEERQVYILAWAEEQEGAAMRVSLYGPEGGLLAEYDTGRAVPAEKAAGPAWPRLVLDAGGLKLCRLDAVGEPYFALPAEKYRELAR